jgi:hypothetical protein
MNAQAAAERPIAHWSHRGELFGDRAFYPMVQLGLGVLTRNDLVVLQTGSIEILPHHSQGQAVLYIDCSKFLNMTESSIRSRQRYLFYMLMVLAENQKSWKRIFSRWLSYIAYLYPTDRGSSSNVAARRRKYAGLLPRDSESQPPHAPEPYHKVNANRY